MIDKLYLDKPADARLLDGIPEPHQLPAWLSQQDLDYYVTAYKATGITSALNFYRNNDENFHSLKEVYQKEMRLSALFIGGAEEAAVRFGSLEPMKKALPKLKKTIVLQGCGHWVQQERQKEVNDAVIAFLEAGCL